MGDFIKTEVTYMECPLTSIDRAGENLGYNELSFLQLGNKGGRFASFLYMSCGEPWNWYERNSWSVENWNTRLNQKNVRIFAAMFQNSPIGFFELNLVFPRAEIVYFGLFPEFTHQGHGKKIMAKAKSMAYDFGCETIWLHTCDLDDPGAVGFYQSCNFSQYHRETQITSLTCVNRC
ncbi:MAG: GNAT family N-acetyltransferase [Deltaproteobacteria bacterium]|nr:GNAT family N-acetyltransferase [Deltaproteobacteria bacterium]